MHAGLLSVYVKLHFSSHSHSLPFDVPTISGLVHLIYEVSLVGLHSDTK